MAMLPGDYKRRVQSATKGASISSGLANLPVPVSPDEKGHKVVSAGGVMVLLTINTTSTTGVNMWFQDSAGTQQEILIGAIVARDYKLHFYCPWDVYVSTDVNATCIVSAPSKGNTAD